jgi:ketosteroid isomerase-like protein
MSQPEAGLPSKETIMIQSTESAERIRELLDRNLQEVFGEGDDNKRRAAIDELWAEDAVLYVPPGAIVGREAIDKFAGDLRATHPHFVYTPHGAPQVLHNAGRLAWGSGPRGAAFEYTGWDVLIVRDGKIAALYVFLDETSDEFRRASAQPAV